MGGKVRVGVSNHFQFLKKQNLLPLIIGVSPNSSNQNDAEYTGFIPKEEYRKIMKYCYIGFYAPQNTCQNIYYSMPNKLFEYLQAGLPILINNMKDMAEFVTDNNIGIVFTKNITEQHITNIIANYNIYIDNISIAKEKYNWENQELDLFKIYDFDQPKPL